VPVVCTHARLHHRQQLVFLFFLLFRIGVLCYCDKDRMKKEKRRRVGKRNIRLCGRSSTLCVHVDQILQRGEAVEIRSVLQKVCSGINIEKKRKRKRERERRVPSMAEYGRGEWTERDSAVLIAT
jgi:hypothetical protein